MTASPESIAKVMTEEMAREEEAQALQDQYRAAQLSDATAQLSTAVQMIAELLQIDFMEAGKRVAERQRRERENA